MAIRFHRSLKDLPGVRLNLGKRDIGISALGITLLLAIIGMSSQ